MGSIRSVFITAFVLLAAVTAAQAGATVFYQQDFDADDGAFTVTGGQWQWGVPITWPSACQEGSRCWGTNLQGNYSNNANAVLTSPVIDLTAASGPIELVWWQALHMESEVWDQAFAEVSIDGGAWQEMWRHTGTTSQTGWTERSFDLSAAAGEQIQLRFRISTDSSVTFSGYYIDNIIIRAFGQTVAVSLSVNDGAAGTVTGPSEFVLGEEVTVTATANPGFQFINWTEDGIEVSTQAAYTFTVDGPRNLVANFEALPADVQEPVAVPLGSPFFLILMALLLMAFARRSLRTGLD